MHSQQVRSHRATLSKPGDWYFFPQLCQKTTNSIYLLADRLQLAGGKEKYKDIPTAVRKIMNEEGISALYKGAVPRMSVVGPLFSITLLSFEAMKAYMISHGLL